jgi:hypothetical protein
MPTCNCKLKSGQPCIYNAKKDSLYCGIHKSCKSPKDKVKSPKPKSKSPEKPKPKSKSPEKPKPKPKSPKAKPKSNCPPGKEQHPLDPKKCLVICKDGLERSKITMRCQKTIKVEPEPEKGESISLLITGHGIDMNEFSKEKKEEFKHIKVAYRIPHDTLNFIYEKYFLPFERYYIYPTTLYSNKVIMERYIKDCENNKMDNTNNYKVYYDSSKLDPSRYESPVGSMIKNKKECYVGHVIMNRQFWFGDKKWKKEQKIPEFMSITSPFMGNMYVLRAVQKDGKMLKGELLSKMKKDGLDHLRKSIQSIILYPQNDMSINFNLLLPILQKFYKRVYIYDFACRTANVKTDRKTRQDIYKEEIKSFT